MVFLNSLIDTITVDTSISLKESQTRVSKFSDTTKINFFPPVPRNIMNFIQTGNVFSPASEGSVQVHKKLPVANYKAIMTMAGPILQQAELEYKIPKKLYGNVIARAERVITAYMADETKNLGAAFVGLKGQGKTMLIAYIGAKCLELGIPVVNVISADDVTPTIKLITSIRGRCVVVFDEFEKTVNEKNQVELLSLLDGIGVQNKLYLFSANNEGNINDFIKSRPGRVRYWFRYAKIDEDVVREYLTDHVDEKFVDELSPKVSQITDLSFDILKAICEEVKMFGDSGIPMSELLECLNIAQERTRDYYTVNVYNLEGTLIASRDLWSEPFHFCDSIEVKPEFVKKYTIQWINIDTNRTGKSTHIRTSGIKNPAFNSKIVYTNKQESKTFTEDVIVRFEPKIFGERAKWSDDVV